jgi:hypothetical protein
MINGSTNLICFAEVVGLIKLVIYNNETIAQNS